MPNLIQSLQGRDLGHLRIVAGLWGMELVPAETEAALQELTTVLLDPGLVGDVVDSLSAQARSALETLAEAGGKMPWVTFARQFGELRETGPGRRDREQVYLSPVSIAETLFYRAFLVRAFFDTPHGAQEFAYIPEDLLEIIKKNQPKEPQAEPFKPAASAEATDSAPLGRPANPRERAHPIPAADRLLDDATTFLAALRMGIAVPEMHIPAGVISEFLKTAGIVIGEVAQPGQVKSFLEMPRLQALAVLTRAWRTSETFNELHLVPGLVCEGEWINQPRATREFLLHLLEALPEGKWWSLPAFIRAIKEKYPDFQRPVGDYDSWFIKRLSDGAYLRGFASWDEVEAALVRYLITGPMFWLELVELATPEDGELVSAFRVNERPITSTEEGKLTVLSNGRISVPRLVPRAARYLIARFCEWEPAKPDEYRYRLTTGSLEKARKQGLKVGQLLNLLARNAVSGLPPVFVRALKRWQLNGTEARVEVHTVLRVTRPEVLEELRKSKAGRFLGESLGPVTVIVKPGAQSNMLAALAELGLLAEVTVE
jgi:Helicase conserved C-terminal domain